MSSNLAVASDDKPSRIMGQDLMSGKVECSICLLEIFDAEQKTRLSCGHVYHSCCINSWLQKNNLSCPLCKADVDPNMVPPAVEPYRVRISHQEMTRICDEIEQFMKVNPDPSVFVSVAGLTNYLCVDLGYEDAEEFEDALQGTLIEFLNHMPQFETEVREDGDYVRMAQAQPDCRPAKMTFHVCEREDLWRVFDKSPDAIVTIPEIEFEFGIEHKRQVDTMYNFICSAIFNLSEHCRINRDHLPNTTGTHIAFAIEQLNRLLDVEVPFTWQVVDTSGRSSFRPDDAVHIQYLDFEGLAELDEEEEEEDAPKIEEEQ